ncbi:SDR family NAD(P)-dependent oxidoreductase [Sphingopyxis sp.]|uniref:SDR family NAD(P)-dependent oxidoreductase n=1 Tax=Sphingopyxis sp. TaxID=1908224 RepID=UPI002DEFA6C3|nr:SDR family NAD(P)-dependent oxidoreductase [Sphingopyxis sp.]
MTGSLGTRRALVTGGGKGLGRAIGEALAGAGARVAVLDLDIGAAAETVAAIGSAATDSFAIEGSVSDPDGLSDVFAALDARWGGLDILVNNAGINMNQPTLDLSIEDWRRTVSINLDGTFFCAREAAERMRGTGGSIVNLSSIYGIVAAPNRAAYCATKAAVSMLTQCLAIEWAELGIRVNAVAPGYVLTPAIETLSGQGKVDLAAVQNRTPQKRLAEPAEIADAVLYLCEDRSRHITGQTLAVDGGWTAYGYL